MSLVTGSWLLDAALVLVVLLYWYMTRNFSFWKKLGVPYMKPLPIVGNMGGVLTGRQHMGDPAFDCYREAGERRFMGMFAFDEPLLVVKDPELVGRVLSTDFSTFYSLNVKFDPETDHLISLSLFGTNGPKWKALRSKLSPAFTSGKIKRMFQLVDAVGEDLARHLGEVAEKGGVVGVRDVMSRYTTDAVCSVFMGVDCGALKDGKAPLRSHLNKVLRNDLVGRITQTIVFFAPNLLRLLRIPVGSQAAVEFVHNNTIQMMKERKSKGIMRGDIVDMLMRIRDEQLSDDEDSTTEGIKGKPSETDAQLKFDDDTVTSQITSFLAAGFDTSASTISFALFELAVNQDLQERLRQHIRGVLEKYGRKVSYEAMQEMTQLTDVVNETLRLYPPVRFHDRKAMQDYRIPGTNVVLPKGTGVIVSVTGLHTDPRYWKEPQRFKPERFSDGSSQSRPGYTFLPFGEGPRACIGIRVGYMQVKLGLIHILSNFKISPTAKTPVSMPIDNRSFIVQPKGDFPLEFTRISVW